mgnify:CR=1 FL=1
MYNILITGGAGFIGSNLIENLLKNKNKVVIIDNFNDYYDTILKERNIKDLIKTKNNLELDDDYLNIYRGDIRDKNFIRKVFNENKINMVIHLAAMVGVRQSLQYPDDYYNVNVNGTLNILEACKEKNIKKFIFASSSSVYGNNQKIPFSENDNVDFPISPYAASKKAGELLCHTYYHLYDISVACLRFFTVYGPRQRPDLAISKFTHLILNNEEIPFYGDGNSERDYTYIDDTIDGIMKTINWINKEKKQFELFNLGESCTISLNQVVETIEKELNKKAIIKKLPMQPGDVEKTFADISKSKEILNYNPKTNFEEGITKFVSWYKENNE